MKKIYLTFLTACLCLITFQTNAENITIIESQSQHVAHDMDLVWQSRAIAMGHTATIVPQSTLNSLSNLSTTDVLIVSSAIITLNATQLQTITDYVQGGGAAYIQSEYTTTLQGNITFASIMQDLGTDFAWSASNGGSSIAYNILGGFATTPNSVSTVSLTHGLTGTATSSSIEKFLEHAGTYIGFCYDDISSASGVVITVSDQDWIINEVANDLVGNMLARLVSHNPLSTKKEVLKNSISAFPNPSNGKFTIDLGDVYSSIEANVANVNGQIVFTQKRQGLQKLNLDIEDFAPGVYFVNLLIDNKKSTLKILKH